MKKNVLVSILLLILFIACQFVFRQTWHAGGMCIHILPDGPEFPSPEGGHPLIEGSRVGWPIPFLVKVYEGCFDERQSQVKWNIPFLLLDLLVMVGLVVLPHIVSLGRPRESQ